MNAEGYEAFPVSGKMYLYGSYMYSSYAEDFYADVNIKLGETTQYRTVGGLFSKIKEGTRYPWVYNDEFGFYNGKTYIGNYKKGTPFFFYLDLIHPEYDPVSMGTNEKRRIP